MGRVKAPKTPREDPLREPFPPIASRDEVRRRLELLFPASFADRGLLVGEVGTATIFVFLYGGFIEGHGRYLRPAHVYLFTEEQSRSTDDEARGLWVVQSLRKGFRPAGVRWYADNSRETIRDDLIRNRLIPIGVVGKRPGVETTSSLPTHYLTSAFAALFDPAIDDVALATQMATWRDTHLSPRTLQRMALRAHGIEAKSDDVLVTLPDQQRIKLSIGKSALIVKDLIEAFASRHLQNPAVLWVSTSDKKVLPQFAELAAKVGLHFDASAELPDLVLADLGEHTRFFFCEVVASDGPVTEERKKALLRHVQRSNLPTDAVAFLSAFEDRNAPVFRKTFSQIAVESLVWFRSEPDLLVELTTSNRSDIDPNR
jgi:hypothetical protein